MELLGTFAGAFVGAILACVVWFDILKRGRK